MSLQHVLLLFSIAEHMTVKIISRAVCRVFKDTLLCFSSD